MGLTSKKAQNYDISHEKRLRRVRMWHRAFNALKRAIMRDKPYPRITHEKE